MRDIRSYSKQTLLHSVIGGLFVIIIVGDILIYIFYGRDAAIFGLMCIFIGMIPILFVWLILLGLEWIIKQREDS